MHQLLALDPFIDLVGRRLPNRFVDPRGGDTEVEIAAMTEGAGSGEAVLIFPEGGNLTPARRQRAIERLEEAGHAQQAAWARAMRHVLPPRPGGTLASMQAAPHARVFVLGHVGVPVGMGEMWRRLPARQTIVLRVWIAEGEPEDHVERIDWLFGVWRELDDWVEARAGGIVCG
jgi:1-acyl-sn-glycerol-3-phosphate acyltransferase